MNTELSLWDTLIKLPKTEAPRTTMLDILDVATKEIYITQAYAYFLDHRNGFPFRKKFATIFFKHLLGSEEAAVKWLECEVRAEQTVYFKKKPYRIDLLFLKDKEAIIVENKIFAGKYNDLSSYEKGVENLGFGSIIKSCFLSFDEKDPRSITHQAICSEMREVLLRERSSENELKYYQMLEFVEHLIKLNKIMGNIIDANAYIEHSSAINIAIQLKQRALEYIDLKIREIALELIATHMKGVANASDESLVEQKKGSWIHVRPRPGGTDIYLTIAYRDFLEVGKTCPVYLIIESTDIRDERIEGHFKEMVENLDIKRSDRQTSSWRHYFFAEVKMTENEEIDGFHGRVKDASGLIFEQIVKFESEKSHV